MRFISHWGRPRRHVGRLIAPCLPKFRTMGSWRPCRPRPMVVGPWAARGFSAGSRPSRRAACAASRRFPRAARRLKWVPESGSRSVGHSCSRGPRYLVSDPISFISFTTRLANRSDLRAPPRIPSGRRRSATARASLRPSPNSRFRVGPKFRGQRALNCHRPGPCRD